MIIFVCGITCSGKDTICEHFANLGNGVIQVGKELRRRHPAAYFEGLGAMQKTEDEAWDIFSQQYKSQYYKEKIFVSGQPRLRTQVRVCNGFAPLRAKHYIFIDVDDNVAIDRIHKRFTIEQDRDLAHARLKNDKVQCYEVIMGLVDFTDHVYVVKNNGKLQDCLDKINVYINKFMECKDV